MLGHLSNNPLSKLSGNKGNTTSPCLIRCKTISPVRCLIMLCTVSTSDVAHLFSNKLDTMRCALRTTLLVNLFWLHTPSTPKMLQTSPFFMVIFRLSSNDHSCIETSLQVTFCFLQFQSTLSEHFLVDLHEST